MVGGGWVVGSGLLAPRDGRVSSKNENFPRLLLFHTKSSRTNPLTAPRVPGVLLYVLLHCCAAVRSKYRFDRWVGGGCIAPSVVGGWAVRYVGVFFRPVGDEPFFFVSKIPASHWCLGVPPAHWCILLSFTIYRTYCCAAVLLPCYYLVFFSTYIQRMLRRTAPIFFSRHTGWQLANLGSTTS